MYIYKQFIQEDKLASKLTGHETKSKNVSRI